MKKIKLSIIGLAVISITTLGLSFTSETPKTQLGYVALNIGDTLHHKDLTLFNPLT